MDYLGVAPKAVTLGIATIVHANVRRLPTGSGG